MTNIGRAISDAAAVKLGGSPDPVGTIIAGASPYAIPGIGAALLSADPSAMFHQLTGRLSEELTKDQARASLLLLRYRPRESTKAGSIWASATPETLKYVQSVADSDKKIFSVTPEMLAKALAGKQPKLAVRTKDEAQDLLDALRDAPEVFQGVHLDPTGALVPSVHAWVQRLRTLAEETDTDEKLRLGPPPPTLKQAADLSRKEAQQLMLYWKNNPDDAAAVAASEGSDAARTYAVVWKKSELAADANLERIFRGAGSKQPAQAKKLKHKSHGASKTMPSPASEQATQQVPKRLAYRDPGEVEVVDFYSSALAVKSRNNKVLIATGIGGLAILGIIGLAAVRAGD